MVNSQKSRTTEKRKSEDGAQPEKKRSKHERTRRSATTRPSASRPSAHRAFVDFNVVFFSNLSDSSPCDVISVPKVYLEQPLSHSVKEGFIPALKEFFNFDAARHGFEFYIVSQSLS